MAKKKFDRILFFGRYNCENTLKVLKFLKSKSKKVFFYKSKKVGEILNIKRNHLKCDYIFCFRSYFILKKKHINAPKFSAVNFHPAPPEYRGSGVVNFSIYNKEKKFGCTAHIINEKIDSGKIIDVHRFKVTKDEGVEQILSKTHKHLLNQAKKVINKLYMSRLNLEIMINKSKKIKWSNVIKKKKDLDKFYEINLKLSDNDFKQKILATKYLKFKPFIKFKSKKFFLEE